MKTLNNINYNDLYSGCGVTCKYSKFTILIHNGYFTIKYNNHVINDGCLYSNTTGKIKNEIKNIVNRHDIKHLLSVSIDTLKNSGFSSDDIEKLFSYEKLKNDTDRKHKKINSYLMNEIKEYFIFRIA